MAWGLSWGKAWGVAFGDAPADAPILTGSGSLDQPCGESHGIASIPGAALPVVAPDAYPGGGVPSTYLLRESAERNGYALSGIGQAAQPLGDAIGVARIKLVSLVATSATVSAGSGEAAATAEFRDIELEMVAMLLAA